MRTGPTQRRRATRSQVWPETKAYLEFLLPNNHDTVQRHKSCGDVKDIGAGGMFLKTGDFIPVATNLGITICFDTESGARNLSISAQGQVVRSSMHGIGIRFTSIDLNKFRDCLIKKINRTHSKEKSHPSAANSSLSGEHAAEQTLNSNPKASETVLVAEDDSEVRELVAAMLQRQGYRVLAGENGEKAFEALKRHKGPINLLLTDVDMPDMNGRELFEKMSGLYPDVKVLYMSGRINNPIAQENVREASINFLQKPFTVQALAAKVREVLG